ncbi:hypothetical protein, partial [Salmonella enterica]|uniref:hypothetical protein n=1 Tax=Salmonella enterica TaxID=28901 RepID=UPI0021B16D4F
ARAIQMVNSRAHINEFMENTTGILRVVLSILPECKIRVPVRIGFDPQTRQMEWDYLDFEHGVNFSMSDIIKGLTYLNMEYG